MDSLFSDYEEVRKSGLFDAEYYLESYPDVASAMSIRSSIIWRRARARGATRIRFRRRVLPRAMPAAGEQPNNPLLHYIRIGAARGFKPGATQLPKPHMRRSG